MSSNRDNLIASLNLALTSPSLNFMTHWQRTSSYLVALLPTLSTQRLETLDAVVQLYCSTMKSRMTVLTYLLDPDEAERTWDVFTSVSAYSEWLLADNDRYDKFIYVLTELRNRYRITADEKGKVNSLMAHLRVKEDYQIHHRSGRNYTRDSEVVWFVEGNWERLDALISYAGERGYTGLSTGDFEGYLTQHKALQKGWL